ncbi:unnamed protein product [Rangifer tarandus platyrhynchus]|uniref:Uncharacterized protein n=1 Tax=Rangifer tarandus platyrhynchus TaxID=3082113 RepID=A0AC59YQ85_RANTA
MGRGETSGVPESRNAGGLDRGRTQCVPAKVKRSRAPLSSRRGSHIHVAVRPAEKDECRTVVPGPCAAPEACGHCSLSGDLTDAALPKWREGSLCAPWTPSPAEAGRQSAGGEGCGEEGATAVLPPNVSEWGPDAARSGGTCPPPWARGCERERKVMQLRATSGKEPPSPGQL